jgi:hypothetical protein
MDKFGTKDDELKDALAGLNSLAKRDREALIAEAAKRGILQNVQVVKVLGFDIPFRSMVMIAFKWMAASLVAALPIALLAAAVAVAPRWN